MSFSILPSLLKSIYTDLSVVRRLHYKGTKGRPEWVFRSGMKTLMNSEVQRFKQQPAFKCFAAKTTISDHKKHVF